jgi:hypothetical protein
MARVVANVATWLAGYVLALLWAWGGFLLAGGANELLDWALLLLVWFASPSAVALAVRRRSRSRPLRSLLGGVAVGGSAATGFVLLVCLLAVTGAGFLVLIVLLDPICLTLVVLAPPVWVALHHRLNPNMYASRRVARRPERARQESAPPGG